MSVKITCSSCHRAEPAYYDHHDGLCLACLATERDQLKRELAECREFWGNERDIDFRNEGVTIAAAKLLTIANTGVKSGTFGSDVPEECAQAILSLRRRAELADTHRDKLKLIVRARQHIKEMAEHGCKIACSGGYLERGMHGPDCPQEYWWDAQEGLRCAMELGLTQDPPSTKE